MPITSTTSPSSRDAARFGGRASPNSRSSAAARRRSSGARAARAAERAVSGRRAPGIATTPAKREQPGERDLGRRRAVRFATRSAPVASSARSARPAERRVRDQRDPALLAPLDDAAAQRTVVERAERDLDRGDRRELERLVELPEVDVRDADAPRRARRPRAARARAPTCATASAGRAHERDRGRSAARRARRGSPRSRRGSSSRGRPGPRRRPAAPSRPSSRSARAGGAAQRAGEQPLVARRTRVPCRRP